MADEVANSIVSLALKEENEVLERAADSVMELPELPPELWRVLMEKLLEFGRQKTLFRLIATNKDMHFLGIPVLYRKVELAADNNFREYSVDKYAKAALPDVMGTKKWSYTRQLNLGFYYDSTDTIDTGFAILEATLSRLEKLWLDVPSLPKTWDRSQLIHLIQWAPNLTHLCVHMDVDCFTGVRLPQNLRVLRFYPCHYHQDRVAFFFKALGAQSNAQLRIYLPKWYQRADTNDKLIEFPDVVSKLAGVTVKPDERTWLLQRLPATTRLEVITVEHSLDFISDSAILDRFPTVREIRVLDTAFSPSHILHTKPAASRLLHKLVLYYPWIEDQQESDFGPAQMEDLKKWRSTCNIDEIVMVLSKIDPLVEMKIGQIVQQKRAPSLKIWKQVAGVSVFDYSKYERFARFA